MTDSETKALELAEVWHGEYEFSRSGYTVTISRISAALPEAEWWRVRGAWPFSDPPVRVRSMDESVKVAVRLIDEEIRKKVRVARSLERAKKLSRRARVRHPGGILLFFVLVALFVFVTAQVMK